MNDKEIDMSESSIRRGMPQKKDAYHCLSLSHSGGRTNPNGQRGWDLNPLNPKRVEVLKRRAREAVREYRHAVDVYKPHQKHHVKKG